MNCILEFLVMPSKATVFNSKCDVAWELSSGAKNSLFYSFDGLHLALCGFGNVAGNIEIWYEQMKYFVNLSVYF